MRTQLLVAFGGPENFRLTDIPIPGIAPGSPGASFGRQWSTPVTKHLS